VNSIPWLLPGALVAFVLAVLLSARVAGLLGTDWRVSILLVAAAGLVVVATLTPTSLMLDYGYRGSGVCDLSRYDPPRLDEWLALDDPALNVVLFVPLGAAIACLPRTRRTLVVIAAAVASPFVIELIQLAVEPLGRGCQSEDVVDNLLGLAIGLAGGTVVVAVGRRQHGP
jgi:hypothetical protein